MHIRAAQLLYAPAPRYAAARLARRGENGVTYESALRHQHYTYSAERREDGAADTLLRDARGAPAYGASPVVMLLRRYVTRALR